jgi:hypothetical protein
MDLFKDIIIESLQYLNKRKAEIHEKTYQYNKQSNHSTSLQ